MLPGESEGEEESARSIAKRHYWRRNDDDVHRWAGLFRGGKSVLGIATEENVAPSTISTQLRRVGIHIRMGEHHVEQLPLRYPRQFIELVGAGPDRVVEFVRGRVWGIGVTEVGRKQVESFCEFVRLHREGVGVKEIARRLDIHRTSVAGWREGTDQPYLIRALRDTLPLEPRQGWKLLPLHLSSGGGEPSQWTRVPGSIQAYEDILQVLGQLRPLEVTYERAVSFDLSRERVDAMRPELFAYLLGMMVGDSRKLGGAQRRYASMNIDLQLTTKHVSNERLGLFVLTCVNSLGLRMERIKDKPPTGRQLLGSRPTVSYRWSSERSPLLAWVFSTCLGLQWDETTTTHPLRMNWMLNMPASFQTRFVQGASDSDGCVKTS